ncbi:MAG TPA: peptidoglycan DD-metalloendopeptidase family protein [Thermoflexia bacterium]|nr:peptidoglycan DD-metalloendopeptidase family protein [Thermoflexia bacterium]
MANALRKFVVWSWRLLGDRQVVVSLLGRYSAHLAMIALAFLLVFLQHISFANGLAASGPLPSLPAVAEPVATPTFTAAGDPISWQTPVQEAIARKALPYTEIPERLRLEVITYTVQINDTVWGIAERFGLTPATIVWSNMETLQGAPWLLQPGLTLDISPVDGAYHTVGAGESVASIAEDYEVPTAAIYNSWNNLERGDTLREGQLLVIPEGIGEDFDWEPPPPPAQSGVASANYSYGFCGNVSVSGPGANGWFILPTGSYAVSGYVFRDPVNPRHNGLDYRCHLGDAIYAADNGVVVYAGWASGYGNLVRIDHGNGFMTYYAHLDSVWVSCGQAVYQGSVVGPCGTTGWSTGPHLHFEIRKGGVPQNPVFYQP